MVPIVSSYPRSRPDVLFYSDIDDSLSTPDMAGMADSAEILQQEADHTVHAYCTGRGLITGQKIAPRFAGFPLRYFAVNNGQNLFINHQGLPADEFIASRRPEDEDQEWARFVQQHTGGWDTQRIITTMQDILAAEGFTREGTLGPPLESFRTYIKGDVRFCLPTDQPAFYVMNAHGKMNDAIQAYGTELRARIGERLTEAGVRWQGGEFVPQGNKVIHFFQPVGITKKTLLEYLLTKYPSVRHVITVGDNANDDMLEPRQFGLVDNHPILAGHHHPREQQLSEHPLLQRVEAGAAGPGIRAHYAIITGESAEPSARP